MSAQGDDASSIAPLVSVSPAIGLCPQLCSPPLCTAPCRLNDSPVRHPLHCIDTLLAVGASSAGDEESPY